MELKSFHLNYALTNDGKLKFYRNEYSFPRYIFSSLFTIR